MDPALIYLYVHAYTSRWLEHTPRRKTTQKSHARRIVKKALFSGYAAKALLHLRAASERYKRNAPASGMGPTVVFHNVCSAQSFFSSLFSWRKYHSN